MPRILALFEQTSPWCSKLSLCMEFFFLSLLPLVLSLSVFLPFCPVPINSKICSSSVPIDPDCFIHTNVPYRMCAFMRSIVYMVGLSYDACVSMFEIECVNYTRPLYLEEKAMYPCALLRSCPHTSRFRLFLLHSLLPSID